MDVRFKTSEFRKWTTYGHKISWLSGRTLVTKVHAATAKMYEDKMELGSRKNLAEGNGKTATPMSYHRELVGIWQRRS